ncbi:MAG: ABC-2 transporter permease [Lachnospiraceae bacterium]|nr:ABC-2 transporter permease [Lachnospiraceae bacterium]
MKVLIYHDIITNKTSLWGAGIILLYIVFAMIMLPFLGNSPEGGADVSLAAAEILNGAIFALNFCFPIATIECSNASCKSKWNTYAAALPGGYKKMLLTKYLFSAIGQFLAVMISILLILFCYAKYDTNVEVPFMFLLLMTGIMLIIQSFLLPLFLMGKSSIVGKIIIFSIILIIYIGFSYLALGDISFIKDGNFLNTILEMLYTNQSKVWCILSILNISGILLMFISYNLLSRHKSA